jgi:hypothetical protein
VGHAWTTSHIDRNRKTFDPRRSPARHVGGCHGPAQDLSFSLLSDRAALWGQNRSTPGPDYVWKSRGTPDTLKTEPRVGRTSPAWSARGKAFPRNGARAGAGRGRLEPPPRTRRTSARPWGSPGVVRRGTRRPASKARTPRIH